eukprot:scaffold7339_cov249-Pinguiococcus_pyrenoidosus.AAC.25
MVRQLQRWRFRRTRLKRRPYKVSPVGASGAAAADRVGQADEFGAKGRRQKLCKLHAAVLPEREKSSCRFAGDVRLRGKASGPLRSIPLSPPGTATKPRWVLVLQIKLAFKIRQLKSFIIL